MKNKKRWINLAVNLIVILLTLQALFNQDMVQVMYLVSFIMIYLLFVNYERGGISSRKLVLLSIMVSISVVSRLLFFFIPGFSPMVSLIILSGIYFGKSFGLMTGLLCPLISNMIYGQGPWTPFQMLVLGAIGGLAGIYFISKNLQRSRILLTFYGVFAGVLFSMIMDIWTVYSIDGFFSLSRYLTVLVPSISFMLIYIISNVLFLNIFIKTMGEKLGRIKKMYEL